MSERVRRRAGRLRRSLVVTAALGIGAVAAPGALAAGDTEGWVMAELGPGIEVSLADQVAERTGTEVVNVHPEIGWATFRYEGNRADAHAALRADPAVWRIDFTRAGENLELNVTPNDEIFNSQHQFNIGGQQVQAAWHLVRTGFPSAWDITRGSSSVRVAVIDSEFDTEHPDLKAKFAAGRNFASSSAEYRTGAVRLVQNDVNSPHGSHVAGIIAAQTNNGIGVAGACWDCVVVPYKITTTGIVGGGTSTDQRFIDDFVEALGEVSRSDAVAVNMSLGTQVPHEPLRAAIANAHASGKVLVASAGNEQVSRPGQANYPAAYPGVIAVAATRPNDQIAEFSTNGDFVDVAAPGDPVLSTYDTRVQSNFGTGYHVTSGTSMSSPLVAGLVALMKTVRPDLTPDEVDMLLKQSALDLGAVGPDPIYGAGRINAVRAVEMARDYVRPSPPPPPPPPPAVEPPPPPPPPPVVPVAQNVRVNYSCTVGRVKVPAARSAYRKLNRNTRLICTGRTTPARARQVLVVQRAGANNRWARTAAVRTNAQGRFTWRTTLRATGRLQYRFTAPANPTTRAIRSPAVRVNVVAPKPAPRRR